MPPFGMEWAMASLKKKWKDFKSHVKEKWFNTEKRDPRVLEEQFQWLVKFWDSDKVHVMLNYNIFVKQVTK